MTIGKMTALAFGLVGGFALGVWTGPHLMQRADRAESAVHRTVVVPSAQEAPDDGGPRGAQARAARARPPRPRPPALHA